MKAWMLVSLSVSTLACATSAANGGRTENRGPSEVFDLRPYLPLAEGNRWRFVGSLLSQPVDREISIVGQDGPWFIDSEGERFRFDSEGLRSPVRYLLRAPIKEGARWQVVISIDEIENYEITSTGVTIQVPAGKFSGCVKVVAQTRRGSTTVLFKEDTFCPNVGWVRIRTWVDIAGRGQAEQTILQLASYSLADRGK